MSNRDRPLNIPYSQVPHGLWTAELTPKARCLLGWLHSHADSYLDNLSLSRIAREFGGGRKSVTELAERLETAGYVRIVRVENGNASHLILMSEPWEALTRVPAPSGGRYLYPEGAGACTARGQVPDPSGVTIEEQLKHQVSRTNRNDVLDASFADFWSLYPRRVSKAAARKSWGAMTEANRASALAVIESHVAMWVAEGRGTATVPHAATWLNRESWDDEVGFVPSRNVRQADTRASRNATVLNGQGSLTEAIANLNGNNGRELSS